jgi:hypothetical protein
MKLTIESSRSYQYRELFKVTAWKDGCVWKTKSLGFIHRDEEKNYPTSDYITSSISTSLTNEDICILDPFIQNQITD